jgi:hypothetical protein
LFAEALRAAKKALDPQGLLNPGVLHLVPSRTCLMTVLTSVPFGVRAGRRMVATGVQLAT